MLITIDHVLDDDQLALLTGLMSGLSWQDGTRTAGAVASQVKSNEQADLRTPIGEKIEARLSDAVNRNAVFQAAAQPHRSSRLVLSKTIQGGGYGWHVDNPFMTADDQTLRTDLSFTLFLSDPKTYEGGALEIEHAGHSQSLKLAAGSMVLYPSTSLHRVTPVGSGERLVCIGWIESRVPRAGDRELLFDMINLRAELLKAHDAQSVEMLSLSKIIANLRRRFN